MLMDFYGFWIKAFGGYAIFLTRATWGSGESHILSGGGAYRPPCDLPNYWTDFQNSDAIIDSPVRGLSKHGVKFDL